MVAFLDHRPVFKGHVLLVPRQHVDTLIDLPDDLIFPLLNGTRQLAAAVCEAFDAQGSFVAMNNVVSQSSRTPSGSRPPWRLRTDGSRVEN
jgi:histidine triad (HIT) family protein